MHVDACYYGGMETNKIPNGTQVKNTEKFNAMPGLRLIKRGTLGTVVGNVEGKGLQAGINFAIVEFAGCNTPQELRTDMLRAQ